MKRKGTKEKGLSKLGASCNARLKAGTKVYVPWPVVNLSYIGVTVWITDQTRVKGY